MPKPIRLSDRCRRIVFDIATIADDKDTYDKATRKQARNTNARHIEAWMRLDDKHRRLEDLSDEEHLKEVEAAIAAIPLLGAAHYERLSDELAVVGEIV